MEPNDTQPRTVLTIDSTLRDGEQAPGVYFTGAEKLALARALDEAGVTMLDAGFPVVSREEAEAFRGVAAAGLAAKVFATVRPSDDEIQLANSLGAQGVFLFFPISRILSGLIRSVTLEQFQDQVRRAVRGAVKLGLQVIVVLEDAGRAAADTEADVIAGLIDEGVDTFIVAESVGSMTPWGMHIKITRLRETFPDIALGIHCHDDYGLATANSLAAIEAGAVYFSGTVNGLGERAGNAALEEVTVAARQLLKLNTDVRPEKLLGLCRLVEETSGMVIPPVKAVCGANTFRCESGLHSRALLRKKGSYESFAPELVGQKRSFVFGKHTGMEYLAWYLEQQGLELQEEKMQLLLRKIKSYQESHKGDALRNQVLRSREFYRDSMGLDEQTFAKLLEEVRRG